MSIRQTSAVLLGTRLAVRTTASACAEIVELAKQRKPIYICFATAHMLVEARRNATVREAYSKAGIVAPDGMPLAWGLRLRGFKWAECISGPRMLPLLLAEAAKEGIPVGFYGGREETLQRIRSRIDRDLEKLQVAYMHSPPFRPLTEREQRADLNDIASSKAQLLFVGLGSPKQECWMSRWSSTIPCVSLGVGAAFEFYSGEKMLPPVWIQKVGLNWLVRLCQEPRRLFRRNLASPVFAALFLQESIAKVLAKGRSLNQDRIDSIAP